MNQWQTFSERISPALSAGVPTPLLSMTMATVIVLVAAIMLGSEGEPPSPA